MPCRNNSRAPALTLLSLTLLLAGCASESRHSLPPPEVVPPAAIPRLAQQARQPKTPPECLPTCSAGASREFDSWLSSPTSAAPPARPASAPTTR